MNVSLFLILLLIFPGTAASQDSKNIFIREDFRDLDDWRPLYFPKIKNHTLYTIEARGEERYLRAESISSASALIYKKEFNAYEYPYIRWRWRVEKVYEKGDPGTKEGDDYTLRVYITFKYDPQKAGLIEKLRYEGAKLLYGEYPPHSALNYVWGNKEVGERIVTSPYTEKTKIILLRKGTAGLGMWHAEEVNILEDYRTAFGEDPPAIASIAVMNDSDNTGESSASYIDYIEVYR